MAATPSAMNLARSEQHKKMFVRAQEIMAQHDGGRDADPAKAIATQGWEVAWQEGVTPWANVRINVPVPYLHSKGLAIPKSGKALIPGCGTGDDVVIFSKAGYDALGIDSAATAVTKGQEFLKTLAKDEKDGKTEISGENFFTWEPTEGFDVIYDYTFFVAIPPTIRKNWGESMKRLIAPGGALIATVFPIDGDRQDGPPYSVSLADYTAVLPEEDWDLIFDEAPPQLPPPMVGKARIAVWKSKKTA